MSDRGHAVISAADVRTVRLNARAKRALDIAVALCLLPPSLVAIAILYVLVRLDSPGPGIFIQQREGKDGVRFRIFKLRTMTADGETLAVTRIGETLRCTHLDELPQLINVLTGDMSIVGPRPHTQADNDAFEALSPGFRARLRVKPGLTGLAQVNGFVGQIQTEADLQGRRSMDLAYIRDASIMLDLKLIYLTAVRVLDRCLDRR